MKDVTDLVVNQIRIFPVDVIPLNIITTQSCIQKIKENFSISFVEPPPFVDGIISLLFQKGEFKSDGQIIVINKIEIEPRRIILEIFGTSKQADQIYESLLLTISAVVNTKIGSLRQPLLKAENTRCVITLDFHFSKLFNNAFIDFLNNNVMNKASTGFASGIVEPLGIFTQITYQIKDENLIKNKISMNPKQLSIAPRPGIPSDEKRYITSSPFDSDTHLSLLKSLNTLMTKSIKK